MAYEVKGKTTTIRATSRASVKVRDNFYTVEWCEERTLPDTDDVNIEQERQALWDTCNEEVDRQIEEIVQTFKK